MDPDEVVDVEAHRPRGAVVVVALEIDGLPVPYDLACLVDHETVHPGIVG